MRWNLVRMWAQKMMNTFILLVHCYIGGASATANPMLDTPCKKNKKTKKKQIFFSLNDS